MFASFENPLSFSDEVNFDERFESLSTKKILEGIEHRDKQNESINKIKALLGGDSLEEESDVYETLPLALRKKSTRFMSIDMQDLSNSYIKIEDEKV